MGMEPCYRDLDLRDSLNLHQSATRTLFPLHDLLVMQHNIRSLCFLLWLPATLWAPHGDADSINSQSLIKRFDLASGFCLVSDWARQLIRRCRKARSMRLDLYVIFLKPFRKGVRRRQCHWSGFIGIPKNTIYGPSPQIRTSNIDYFHTIDLSPAKKYTRMGISLIYSL